MLKISLDNPYLLKTEIRGPECNSDNQKINTTYTVNGDEQPKIFSIKDCGNFFYFN